MFDRKFGTFFNFKTVKMIEFIVIAYKILSKNIEYFMTYSKFKTWSCNFKNP